MKQSPFAWLLAAHVLFLASTVGSNAQEIEYGYRKSQGEFVYDDYVALRNSLEILIDPLEVAPKRSEISVTMEQILHYVEDEAAFGYYNPSGTFVNVRLPGMLPLRNGGYRDDRIRTYDGTVVPASVWRNGSKTVNVRTSTIIGATAVGDGVADDSGPIQAAINYAAERAAEDIRNSPYPLQAAASIVWYVYLPATEKFYQTKKALQLKSNVALVGDGYKSYIKNTASLAAGLENNCVVVGTYGGEKSMHSATWEVQCEAENIAKNSNAVTLRKGMHGDLIYRRINYAPEAIDQNSIALENGRPVNFNDFQVGDIVFLRSPKPSGGSSFSDCFLNRIVGIQSETANTGPTLILEDRVPTAIQASGNFFVEVSKVGSLSVAHAQGGGATPLPIVTSAYDLGEVESSDGVPAEIISYASVQALRLENSAVNGYTALKVAAYKCHFQNLDLKGSSVVLANPSGRCRFLGVRGLYRKKLMEFDYYCSENILRDWIGIRIPLPSGEKIDDPLFGYRFGSSGNDNVLRRFCLFEANTLAGEMKNGVVSTMAGVGLNQNRCTAEDGLVCFAKGKGASNNRAVGCDFLHLTIYKPNKGGIKVDAESNAVVQFNRIVGSGTNPPIVNDDPNGSIVEPNLSE